MSKSSRYSSSLRPAPPPTMTSSSTSIVDLLSDTGSDSDVQIVAPSWDYIAKASTSYKVADALLTGRKYGSPALDDQRNLLASFLGHPGKDYFTGERVTQFNQVAAQLKATHSATTSTLKKNWNLTYVVEKLALMLCLVQKEDMEKKVPAASMPKSTRSSSKNKSTKKSATKKSTNLHRAIHNLKKVYNPVYTKYQEAKKADANKKNKTPSLNHQKSGLRLQDSVQFRRSDACLSNCPVCNHGNTMALSKHSDTNAENERRRREAGNDSFEGVSIMVGCYCFQLQSGNEDDCPCQVVFEEKNRQAIALATARNKARENGRQCKCVLSCIFICLSTIYCSYTL